MVELRKGKQNCALYFAIYYLQENIGVKRCKLDAELKIGLVGSTKCYYGFKRHDVYFIETLVFVSSSYI